MIQDNSSHIYTIGHSTHTFQEFLDMLQSFSIEFVVDVRSLPGSRIFPQVKKENLEILLPETGIQYIHLADLWGRRKGHKDSHNTRWNNPSFRAYADYMETEEFQEGISKLTHIADTKTVAYMCSEAVRWRCHRSMISDYLKSQGWTVLHIMAKGKAQEHPYTSPAQIIENQLSYA